MGLLIIQGTIFEAGYRCSQGFLGGAPGKILIPTVVHLTEGMFPMFRGSHPLPFFETALQNG